MYSEKSTLIPKTTATLNEVFVHFSTLSELIPGAQPIKIPFTLEPDSACKQVAIKFELLDKTGKVVKEGSVIWEADEKPIHLELTSTDDIKLQGAAVAALNIVNKAAQPTEAGKLKLKIARIVGTEALISGATYVEDQLYEMDLGILVANGNIAVPIQIVPGREPNAEFELQVWYDGKKINKAVRLDWKKGVSVALRDVQYDKNTRQITYTVENDGTEPIEDLHLKYTNKTPNLYLGLYHLKELNTERIVKVIDHLGPGQKLEKQTLGELDFSRNLSAEFEFILTYQGGATTPRSCIFAKDNLGLILDYDPIKSEVSYTITNKNDTEAKNVQLQYKNASLFGSKKSVTLTGRTEDITAAANLAPKTGQTTGTFSIDFKGEDDVMFEFKVLYQGAMIVRKLEQFHAPKVDLELKLESNPNLEGEEREIKLKIESKPGSRPLENIALAGLELVRTGTDDDKLLSKDPDGRDQIGTIFKFDNIVVVKNAILLYLNINELLKGRATKDFTFKLLYKKELQAKPVVIHWKRTSDVEITSSENKFVDTALFRLEGPDFNKIDSRNLTIDLTFEDDRHHADFELVGPSGQSLGAQAPFSQLIKGTTFGRTSDWARLRLLSPNEKHEEKVTMLLKRNGTLINSCTIFWRMPKYQLRLDIQDETFNDKRSCEVQVINHGDVIDTDKIGIKLINSKGISFQLGKIKGDQINTNLAEISGTTNVQFTNRDSSYHLTLNRELSQPIPNLYWLPMDFILETLSNKGKKFSTQVNLTWINTTKIEKEIKQALEDPLCGAQEDFEAAKKKMDPAIYDPKLIDIQQICQARKRAVALQEKARKKLADEKDLLYDDLKERIQTSTIQPAEQLIQQIGDYRLQFFDKANKNLNEIKGELERYLKSIEKVDSFNTFELADGQVDNVNNNILGFGKNYYNASEWHKAAAEYQNQSIGGPQNVQVEELYQKINEAWASIETSLRSIYEAIAKIYAPLMKEAKQQAERDNFNDGVMDKQWEHFRKFNAFISNAKVQLDIPVYTQIAQVYQEFSNILETAVNKATALEDKSYCAEKVYELINSTLFQRLEAANKDKKAPTELTKASKATLEAAQRALGIAIANLEVVKSTNAIRELEYQKLKLYLTKINSSLTAY